MTVWGIAIWFVTFTNREQRVLLHQATEEKAKKYGEDNLYQPVQGWLAPSDSFEGANRRAIRRVCGEEFFKELVEQYPCCELSCIRKEKFSLPSGEPAVRFHYLAIITAEQLALIPTLKASRIRYVSKEDLSKLKRLGYPSGKGDIVLYPEHHEILCSLLLTYPKKLRECLLAF